MAYIQATIVYLNYFVLNLIQNCISHFNLKLRQLEDN